MKKTVNKTTSVADISSELQTQAREGYEPEEDPAVDGHVEGLEKQINYEFASEWTSYIGGESADGLDNYLKSEIQKLIDEDYAVLTSILQLKEVTAKTRALILFGSSTEFSHYTMVRLSLLPAHLRDKDIPVHDYNGCLLPPAKRGKVLAAMCALRSEYDNEVKSDKPDEATTQKMFNKYSATASFANADKARRVYRHPNGPYVCIEISENGTFVSVNKAVSILTGYGYGVAYSRTGIKKPWFVQELELIGEGN